MNTELMSAEEVLAVLQAAAWTLAERGCTIDEFESSRTAVAAMAEREAAQAAELDAYRAVLREFQDGRRISNPHTRQVARDIEQQVRARAEAART